MDHDLRIGRNMSENWWYRDLRTDGIVSENWWDLE